MPLCYVAQAGIQCFLSQLTREASGFLPYPLFNVHSVSLIANVIGHVAVFALSLVMPLAIANPVRRFANVAAMSDAHNENEKDLAFDLVENPIVAHAQPVKLIFASDLLNSLRVGILRERINSLFNLSPYRTIKGFEVSQPPAVQTLSCTPTRCPALS